tara:strand:- start:276 stop:641 length:366 start_codon:yes stop_codon:yes gene_type:complete
MGEQPINIRTLVHHIEHLVLYSLILWQIVLGLRYLIKIYFKNWKPNTNSIIIDKNNSTYNDNNLNSDNIYKKKDKNLKAVEVGIKKDIFIDKVDKSNIKTDEIIKGKTKTQKDKLKSLRGK